MKGKKLDLGKVKEVTLLLARMEKLKKTQRWGKYPQAGMCSPQNSWDHTLRLLLLGSLVIVEVAPHYPDLKSWEIINAILFHDFGEVMEKSGDPGDIMVPDKKNDDKHQGDEAIVFIRLFNSINKKYRGRILKSLLPAYLLQYTNTHGGAVKVLKDALGRNGIRELGYILPTEKKFEAVIFDAIEKLGYVVDIYDNYLAKPDETLPLFVDMLKTYDPILFDYAGKIKGFNKFYTDRIRAKVLAFLKQHKDISPAKKIANEIIRSKQLKLNDLSVESSG